MKMSRTLRIGLLLLGFAVYAASFPLVAVKETGSGGASFIGYRCALLTLTAPWGQGAPEMLHDKPGEYFAWLFSGWINPFFIAAMVASLVRPKGRIAAILRIVTLLMFAACWFVFYMERLRPHTGYFLWTGGMLLVLLPSMFSTENRELKAAGGA